MDDFKNIDDIKAEEKRLYEEYKAKVAELKKVQKETEAVGQVSEFFPDQRSNGNDISNKISKRTSNLWTPSTGGIYPLLKKLEKDGLVIGKWDDPKKKFQKIYYLTDLGEKEFQHRRHLLKPRIEESLKVFQMVYKALYL